MFLKIVFFLLFLPISLVAQPVKKDVFKSPLKVPLFITAGFGELRPDHFHSGIDFSTYGKTQEVVAVEQGYVSRIKVSTTGYGKAVYINHPNGLTTVYGHLSAFNDTLNALVRNLQERGREYELDVLLDSSQFPVQCLENIGYTGSSGSSTAPHLHFEVRDQHSENTMNPLNYGFMPADKTAPDIRAVSIFPKPGLGSVNQLDNPVHLPLVVNKKSRKKSLPVKQKIPVVSGWVGFGFQGGDVIGKQKNLSGIYQIKLLVDSTLVFHCRFDEFSFYETRCINAYLDYPARKRGGKKIQKCIVPPNNLIGIYKEHHSNGYFYFSEDKFYTITYLLADLNGNQTKFEMRLKGKKPQAFESRKQEIPGHIPVIPGMAKTLSLKGFEAIIGTESLFDTVQLKLKRTVLAQSFSDNFELGNSFIPINRPINIRIKPFNFPDSLRNKLLIVRREGTQISALPSNWKGDYLEASSNIFGSFKVEADTVAPKITYKPAVVKSKKGKKSSKSKSKKPAEPILKVLEASGLIRFSITDKLAGVAGFDATLNDKWILLQPGTAKSEWIYRFPDTLTAGEYVLSINASDLSGNRSHYTLKFTKSEPPQSSP
jgi:hypothetical protein